MQDQMTLGGLTEEDIAAVLDAQPQVVAGSPCIIAGRSRTHSNGHWDLPGVPWSLAVTGHADAHAYLLPQ